MAVNDDVARLQAKVHKLSARNEELAQLLQTSRDRLARFSADINALAEPASTYGAFLGYAKRVRGGDHASDAGRCHVQEAEVFTNGRAMRVKISPNVEPDSLAFGQTVRLGEGSIVVEGCGYAQSGALAAVVELIGEDRAIVANSSGEEQVISLAERLRAACRAGDHLLIDTKAGIATEKIDKTEVNHLSLEQAPDTTFADIGGLSAQISHIRDTVELPFAHPELYRAYNLQPPKGVLLYGPPGCGKTLIAKAVANSLAQRMQSETTSYFINVKGPELLNKFVGETERKIRLVFERARELAESDPQRPVIIFFDEMESIFRARGSGISSDMETTVVPQLLTELDGVEALHNVIVIGATNREELIDPAILRPGRLDIKIRIDRPGPAAAREILAKHLPESIPHRGDYDALLEATVDLLYADAPFAHAYFSSGDTREVHFRDFVSGAMIANIVSRAKKLAIKDALAGASGQPLGGINFGHLSAAVAAEQRESEHIPATTSAEDWSRILPRPQRAGDALVRVEIISRPQSSEPTSLPQERG